MSSLLKIIGSKAWLPTVMAAPRAEPRLRRVCACRPLRAGQQQGLRSCQLALTPSAWVPQTARGFHDRVSTPVAVVPGLLGKPSASMRSIAGRLGTNGADFVNPLAAGRIPVDQDARPG